MGLYGSNGTAAARRTAAAASLKAGILDLFWDSQKVDITNDLFIAQNIKLFQSSPSMISFLISIVGAMSSVPLHSIHSGVVSFPTKSQKTRSRPSRPSPLTWFSIAIMAPSPQHLLTQVSNGTHLHSLLRCYSINKDFRDAPNAWPPHHQQNSTRLALSGTSGMSGMSGRLAARNLHPFIFYQNFYIATTVS